MSGIFNASIFNEAIFNTGLAVAVESPAADPSLGFAPPRPPAVDFVISGGVMYGSAPPAQPVNMHVWRAARQEKSELREMAQMYAQWRRAA